MKVRVLGPIEVTGPAGRAEPIRSPSQRVVLALLAGHHGHSVAADTLVGALWGEDPPPSARASLRTYVSRLRRLLGDAVEIRPEGYALVLPRDQVDATRFDDLMATIAAGGGDGEGLAGAGTALDEALELWRGPAFGDVAGELTVRPLAVRLEELRLHALEARAAAALAAGATADAVARAEALVAEHPLREGAWIVLVEALTAAGRAPEAVRAARRAGDALAEAGMVPSARLAQAEAVALAGKAPTLAQRRLPQPSSSFIGRDDEVALVVELLREHRIVSLVGPGGVGKTRLALAVAGRVAGRHTYGARLVELAPVDEAGAVPDVVIDAVGVEADGRPASEVLAQLTDLDVLVVLDCCEHVVDAAARAAELLARAGPRVRVLATSRERIGVDGERTVVVPPLPTEPGGPAQALFLDRATSAGASAEALARNGSDAVERIVRRLDGLPLAIEMAAARAPSLTPPQLADLLEERIDVLRSARRTGSPRHRTLTAVVEWSEALLDPADRELFADLAVFAGAVTAADVAAVTGRDETDAFDGLCRLVDRSLVTTRPGIGGGAVRFGMLRTIRAHARHRLAERPERAGELHRRHAAHVAECLWEADLLLRTDHEARAAETIERLLDEARAAHSWARVHSWPTAVEVTGVLHLFAVSRLRDEPLAWADVLADELLAAAAQEAERGEPAGRPGPAGPGEPAGAPPTGWRRVLASSAQRAIDRGDGATARRLLEVATGPPGDDPELRVPLEIFADLEMFEGNLEASDALSARLAEIARTVDDEHAAVIALVGRALVCTYRGRGDEGSRLFTDEALAARSPSGQGWLAYGLAEAVADTDPDAALAGFDRAVALADAVGNGYLGGIARLGGSALTARWGDPDAAVDRFIAVIEHWRGRSNANHLATTLRNLVVLLQRVDAAAEVAELLGTLGAAPLMPTFGDEAHRLDAAATWAGEVLGAGGYTARAAVGAGRGIDEAAEVAERWLRRLRGQQAAATR